MKAVILAGGKGRRLAPFTNIIPKPLMPVGERPILEILLRQMKCAGINEVFLTVGYQSYLLRLFFGNSQDLGLKINFVEESKPLGTSGPLANIEGLAQTFLVSNGDVLTNLQFTDLIAFHHEQGAIATIATHQRKVNIDLGVIYSDDSKQVIDYKEKPAIDYQVSMGVYVFEPRILDFIPKGEYLDFPNLVLKLLDKGEKVAAYQFAGYWEDLGRPDDYQRATKDFEQMRHQFLPEA